MRIASKSVVAFVCAATCAMAQPRSEPTDLQRKAATVVPAYAKYLANLDGDSPASILRAKDEAVSRYAKATTEDAEAVFRQFWGFYNQVLTRNSVIADLRSPMDALLLRACGAAVFRCRPRQIDGFLQSRDPKDVEFLAARKEATAELAKYRSEGIGFRYGEGEWYAASDEEFVLAVARRLPLGELATFVRFWAVETREPLVEDASLLISWEEWRSRLARWEAFGREHPQLPETSTDVDDHVKWLTAVYVFGIDNTRAYDRATRYSGSGGTGLIIDPKLKASYDAFLKGNQSSRYYPVIQGIVERVNRSGGKPTEDLVSFLKSVLTDPYFKDYWITTADRWLR